MVSIPAFHVGGPGSIPGVEMYNSRALYGMSDSLGIINKSNRPVGNGSVVGCWLCGQAVGGSNPALGYLVSPFRKEN